MGCCQEFARVYLFLFNALAVIFGIVIVILASLAYKGVATEILSRSARNIQISFIVLGVIIAIIAFVGFCGVYKSSTGLLNLYAFVLVLLFIIQIACAIALLAQWTNTEKAARAVISKEMKLPKSPFLDTTQEEFECCGADGPDDYKKNKVDIPESCKADGKVKSNGCAKEVSNYLSKQGSTIGGLAFCLCAIEFLGVISAFTVSKNIKNGL